MRASSVATPARKSRLRRAACCSRSSRSSARITAASRDLLAALLDEVVQPPANPTGVRFEIRGGTPVPVGGRDAEVCCAEGAELVIVEGLLTGETTIELPTRTVTAAPLTTPPSAGSVIVSVGLPQLSARLSIIKDYFNEKNGMGFEYAYMYPGMNKVLQAAGRVIRSETDTGAVLLIDERFSRRDYLSLFPAHWHHCRPIRDEETLKAVLDAFWDS